MIRMGKVVAFGACCVALLYAATYVGIETLYHYHPDHSQVQQSDGFANRHHDIVQDTVPFVEQFL